MQAKKECQDAESGMLRLNSVKIVLVGLALHWSTVGQAFEGTYCTRCYRSYLGEEDECSRD
jgi:hypothetical protein